MQAVEQVTGREFLQTTPVKLPDPTAIAAGLPLWLGGIYPKEMTSQGPLACFSFPHRLAKDSRIRVAGKTQVEAHPVPSIL
jgi:hypothetical protein